MLHAVRKMGDKEKMAAGMCLGPRLMGRNCLRGANTALAVTASRKTNLLSSPCQSLP